jgi:neutral ceramidase
MPMLHRLLAVVLFFLAWDGVGRAASALSLGIAKEDMTPAVGTPLAGYGAYYGQPSQGVHDPLYVRALALSQGDTTVVFVACDLIGIDAHLRRVVLNKIRTQQPMREEAFILVATHTHTGAGALGTRFWQRFIMGLFDPRVFHDVTDHIAKAAIAAMQQPVVVTAALGQTRIDALIENRMDARLRLPHTLKVLQFQAPGGRIVGRLLFMAAHPTLAPWRRLEFSADYPGVVTRALEHNDPGSVTVFVNGAAGDLQPAPTAPVSAPPDWGVAYGGAVAHTVQHLAFSAVALEGPWQGVIADTPLPRVHIRLGWVHVPSWLGNQFLPRRAAMQAVRLGALLFLAFPGELGSETGQEIESLATSQGFTPFIVGYANDYIAYVIPRRYYVNQKLYEARVSFYGPNMDRFLQCQASQLMQRLVTVEERSLLNTH